MTIPLPAVSASTGLSSGLLVDAADFLELVEAQAGQEGDARGSGAVKLPHQIMHAHTRLLAAGIQMFAIDVRDDSR